MNAVCFWISECLTYKIFFSKKIFSALPQFSFPFEGGESIVSTLCPHILLNSLELFKEDLEDLSRLLWPGNRDSLWLSSFTLLQQGEEGQSPQDPLPGVRLGRWFPREWGGGIMLNVFYVFCLPSLPLVLFKVKSSFLGASRNPH